jgi:ligand-binding sensor protein
LPPSPDTHGLPPGDDPPKAAPTEAAAALTDLVGIESLQKLQERFTELGQVTVCICAVTGEPITKPSWGSRYSELIGTSPKGRIEFADAIRECVRGGNRGVPVQCHEGMALYATGIMPENQRLAVLVAGTRSPTALAPKTVRAIAKEYHVDTDELLDTAWLVDPYSGGAPEAIHRFADVLASTIATLYRQAARIERQLADLSVVHQLTELLSGPRDLQEILDLTVKRVVEVMNVKACGIRLLNEQTGELVVKAVHNLSDQYLEKGPVTLADNAIDTAAFAGQAVHIEDVTADPRIRYPQSAVREGIVSGLCVPMAYRGRTVGVLRVYTARRYSDHQQSALRAATGLPTIPATSGRSR